LHSALSETVTGLDGGQHINHPPPSSSARAPRAMGLAPSASPSPPSGASIRNTSSGIGASTGGTGASSASNGGGAVGHLLSRLLAHTAGLRRELKAATVAARREEVISRSKGSSGIRLQMSRYSQLCSCDFSNECVPQCLPLFFVLLSTRIRLVASAPRGHRKRRLFSDQGCAGHETYPAAVVVAAVQVLANGAVLRKVPALHAHM